MFEQQTYRVFQQFYFTFKVHGNTGTMLKVHAITGRKLIDLTGQE